MSITLRSQCALQPKAVQHAISECSNFSSALSIFFAGFGLSGSDPSVQEYRKVELTDAEEGSSTYTFLQWEAKKFPYVFDSWGGDKINESWQVWPAF